MSGGSNSWGFPLPPNPPSGGLPDPGGTGYLKETAPGVVTNVGVIPAGDLGITGLPTGQAGAVLVHDGTGWQVKSAGDLMPWVYGDGSDGDVTLPAGTTVITRDMVYNSLVVPNGAILDVRKVGANGALPIRARQSITVQSGGQILADGQAASGATHGGYSSLAGPAGYGLNGGDGKSNAAGQAGTSDTLGATGGGAGGAGGAATNAGGAAGTVSINNGGRMGYRWANNLLGNQPTGALFRGGGGGGGGAASGANAEGGGGGQGGNVLMMAAPVITVSGTISCKGGAGAAGHTLGTGADAAGGGGGGGGGSALIVCVKYTGNLPDVSGGAGGAGYNGGSAGAAGAAGAVFMSKTF